jgi:histidinol dehydrogenase
MTRVAIRRLDTAAAGFEAEFQRVRHWSAETDAAIEQRVSDILADVRTRGDAAVLDCTARFDGLHADSVAALEIGAAELRAALDQITPAQRRALEAAAGRVRDYHRRQLEVCARSWSYRDADGSLLGQKVTPLDRVGIYVPGGKAAYPSSVLMNAIPAQVAGVGEIVMVVPTPVRAEGTDPSLVRAEGAVPSAAHGERNPLVLAAAAVAGVHRVFTVGGAQAVAALAYGTATIPRVDKITGPGNAYVASAKRRVFGQVGIDMIAGPSEILVLADGTTPPDWVAMDLFSQAEHDELTQSILLSPDAAYIDAVQAAIDRLLPAMPRQAVIRASLAGRGALICTRSMEEACEISNRIAPEHLEVSSRDPQRWEPLLRHAGAIFLGAYTSESLGDYCAGPNHVLPTSGTARFSSPLGVYDFVKRSSLIEVSDVGAQVLGPIAAELAHGEGLHAHARAAEMRLEGPQRAPLDDTEPDLDFEVRSVTEANVDALLKLRTTPEQERFVASVPWSLAQAAYRAAGRPLGLYWQGEPVGFLLLWDSRLDPDAQERADELYIWRLMIDARFQRQGQGQRAMRWLIAEARRLGVAQIGLSHVPENAVGPFYERFGFRYTGRVKDGEHEMVLPLDRQAFDTKFVFHENRATRDS